MKLSNSLFDKIKIDLNNGVISSTKILLDTVQDTSALTLFKEKKLLFIPKSDLLRFELNTLYKKSADRLINDPKQKLSFHLYADFVIVMLRSSDKVVSLVQDLIKNLKQKNLKDIIGVSCEVIVNEREKVFDQYFSFLESKSPDKSHAKLAELNAFALHMVNARDNDMKFAVSNLLNLFAGNNDDIKIVNNDFTEEEFSSFIEALQLSSLLVSYQWVIDKVSYQEWDVIGIQNVAKPVLKFDFIDKKLELSRELGIRSHLIAAHLGKSSKRWLGEYLKDDTLTLIDDFIKHFQEDNQIIFYTDSMYNKLRESVSKSLDLLDAEDELLVFYSQNNPVIISYYLLASLLMCCYQFSEFCRKNMSKKNEYELHTPLIPVEKIKEFIMKECDIDEKNFNQVLEQFVVTLPIGNHYDIINKPNVKIGNTLIGIPVFAMNYWPSLVRSVLYRGGEIANIVGNAWEEFIAYLFKEYGWDVIGTGLKLTKELPDLDIFAIKGELALAIQVKTTYGTGINTFEQWKSRAKILKGIDQANSIKLALNNKTLLNKWLTRKQSSKIRIVESIVVTNSHIYNGWNFKGIPVASIGSLMQIFRGANVKFTSANGQVLSKKKYIEGDPTVENFMDFIRFPLDWKLANETNTVTYKKQESDYVIFKIPSLSRMDGMTESDVIVDGRPTISD